MKSISLFFLSFALITPVFLFSQVEEKNPDVTDKEEEAWELREDEEEVSDKNQAHWAGIDIGFGMNLNSDFSNNFSSSNNPYWENEVGKSLTMNFNFLEYKLPILKQYLGLTTGLGIDFQLINFRSNYVLSHDADTVYAIDDPVQSYKSNYLSLTRLKVPLLIEFATKKETKKCFYFSAGVVGSVRIGSFMRLTGKYDNGDKFDNTTTSKFNLNPFGLEGTIRTGYDRYGAFVSYNLLPLFSVNKTVAVNPIRFVVSFNF